MFKKMLCLTITGYILWVVSCLGPNPAGAIEAEEFQVAFIEVLEFKPAKYLGVETYGRDSTTIDKRLSQFYHKHNLQPFWVSSDGPGKRARQIYDALLAADKEGLDPKRYYIDRIEKYWKSTDAVGLVRLDVLLSLGLIRYVADLREGRIEPFKLDPELFATARDFEFNWDDLRQQVLETQDMKAFLDSQIPPFRQYRKLKEALVKYRKIKANGGWEPVPEGEVLKPGMEDERMPLIRKRLAATGDFTNDSMEGTVYDEKTVEEVKHFQARNGLATDGVIGNETIATMNVPVDKRIRQIIINMERYRWLNTTTAERVLAVNIAGFRLAGVKDGGFELDMPVIVGLSYHKTPVFSDAIKYLVINPYWNIPNSIAKNEMLPKLKKNPNYLKEKNIRLLNGWDPDAEEVDSTTLDWNSMGKEDIVRYRLRQDPGPNNALGTIKFIFPNKYNVYLHDTPVHSLFEQRKRTMSHGCIRVSKPAELAAYVLGGEEAGWGIEKVKQTVESGKRTVVPLKTPFPVYILYRTVIFNPDSGEINFFTDVYGRDALLEKALF